MLNDKVIINSLEQSDPIKQLLKKEIALNILCFGSFLTIINNKKINPVFVFTSVLENLQLRKLFVDITSTNSEKESLLSLLHFFPSLIKSKNTKRLFKKSLKNERP